nr:immunoglobulin heavy chain junction region [Mus musculus]NSM05051.1 immunoglobulin heavy chain junction region [Mus musculus]NSM05102.1 immunoglobulin heavy chain junction region [Mus musculus]NSM05205.1 immunoglobulin heavy chain junction region [Mus musculus]NSM06856.1 immunoglobulin heavy chain junction region [Mus musculus]
CARTAYYAMDYW